MPQRYPIGNVPQLVGVNLPTDPRFTYTGPNFVSAGAYGPPSSSAFQGSRAVGVAGDTSNNSLPPPSDTFTPDLGGPTGLGNVPTIPTAGITGSPGGPGDYNPTLNYYDAGNGITYVYDENWNYVRTENNATPQPTKVSNPITFGSRVGSYYNPSAGGFMPLGGSAISGSTMLPTTWSNANTGNPSVYAPRALPGSFNGGMISMNPADWGASGGIGPQAVTMAAPGPSAIPKNIVHR